MRNIIKGLSIMQDPWTGYVFPTANVVNDAAIIFYSEKSKSVLLSAGVKSRAINHYKASNSDYVEASKEMVDAILSHSRALQSTRERNKEKRYFKAAYAGDSNIQDLLVAKAFLNGTTKGGGNLCIQGNDYLNYYGYILLTRIGKDEYLMGSTMSGAGKNSSAVSSRIQQVIRESKSTFWPTLQEYVTSNAISNSLNVFTWCIERLRVAQLNYKPSTKYGEGYKELRREAVKMYRKAKKRWPGEIPEALDGEFKELISIFGKQKKMEEYNAALLMQYKMTGGFNRDWER